MGGTGNGGKLDFPDISVIKESMGQTVEKGKETVKEAARQLELKALQPIFSESLEEVDFLMPKFIRVVERDKKYLESEVCKGSIGYMSSPKGLQMVNVFRDSVKVYGLKFYPDCDSEFYYIDPSERDKYIALDEYFSYLKIARINELEKIAQDLGAKHFKVTYKEEKTVFSEKKIEGNVKVLAKVDAEHSEMDKKYSTIDIEAESEFTGHKPVKPQLKYMQKDTTIQTLVEMRMNENSKLIHKKYMLKMSHSCGMKERDAMKIDTILKGLKCTGNTTVASEVKNESRRYLEYDIEF